MITGNIDRLCFVQILSLNIMFCFESLHGVCSLVRWNNAIFWTLDFVLNLNSLSNYQWTEMNSSQTQMGIFEKPFEAMADLQWDHWLRHFFWSWELVVVYSVVATHCRSSFDQKKCTNWTMLYFFLLLEQISRYQKYLPSDDVQIICDTCVRRTKILNSGHF